MACPMRLETPAEYLRRMSAVRRERLQERITDQECREKDKPLPPTALRTKRDDK